MKNIFYFLLILFTSLTIFNNEPTKEQLLKSKEEEVAFKEAISDLLKKYDRKTQQCRLRSAIIAACSIESDTIQAHLDHHDRSETRTASSEAAPLLLERPFGVDMAREIIIGIDDTEPRG